MFRIVIVIISLFCLLFLFYGVIFTAIETEPNRCRMTYMFEYPQFVRIHFDTNKYYPKYGLYAYSEGALIEKTRSMDFTGAPVIFLPGNSGSYKQARSLASVAIRKGLNNEWDQHLDYFSVDFNEEYTGLFGGYLETQQQFVKSCIRAVLNLYRKVKNQPKQVILIGHSMGGKIAQSLLADEEVMGSINTIITIASPLDKPVLMFDDYFEVFYKKINKFLDANRTFESLNNETNYCTRKTLNMRKNEPKLLDDKLIISIGGGSRDLMVHSGLTSSKFSDINTLTTSIPNVWLTTDHLCSVWCLQLVLVINRFLHSIIATSPPKNRRYEKIGQQFIEDKSIRLAKAKHFLVKSDYGHRMKEIILPPANADNEWLEDSRRVFSKYFDNGLNRTIFQMIRLVDSPHHKYLSLVGINLDSEDFVMGCAVLDFNDNMRYCRKATSLSNFIEKIPSVAEKKLIVHLDLHKIKDTYPDWTHVVLKFNPTREKVAYNIDIFDPALRFISIQTPKWYSFSQKLLLDDTLYGSSFYKFEINGLDESYQSLVFDIKPHVCNKPSHHAVARTCIPWLNNCDKYHHFTNQENKPFYIDVPNSKPLGYNTTANPVTVHLHLDSNCRYKITYQNSFGGTLSRIVHQYFHWIPAHLTGIALMSFRHQITITPGKLPFKCGKLQTGLLVCSSFFIVTTTRIFAKMFSLVKFLPDPDDYNISMIISLLIHGSAFSFLVITTVLLWVMIYVYGNMAHKILLRIIRLPISLPSITDSVMPLIEKIPITAGILLVSIASASCGGVALIFGCLIYFMLIMKQYEDYLEEFVFHTAKVIAEKLFGKKKNKNDKKNDKQQKEKSETDNTDATDTEDDVELLPKAIEEKSDAEQGEQENKKEIVNDKKSNKKSKRSKKNPKEEQPKENTEIESTSNVTPSSSSVDIIDTKALADKSEILLNAYAESLDNEFPENVSEEELDRLLADAISKQKTILNEKEKKEALERMEYDAVHESYTSINFHMTLLVLMGILTLINFPCTISWAKNYSYNQTLNPDPSFLPAIIVLVAMSFLWQFSTPRNVYGYTVVSGILYSFAGCCILYCQDSFYRLNILIPAVFVVITIQQIFSPRKPEADTDEYEKAIKSKIEKMKSLLKENGNLDEAD